MSSEKCTKCNGQGWDEDIQEGHDPACNALDRFDCLNTCPVQVVIQVECARCGGTGHEVR